MESLLHINFAEFVHAIGYIGIFFIVFAECGLFFGFLFPGDSLLFTAGFLASQKFLDINILVPLIIIATISGNVAGFWMGKKFTDWLMSKKESLFFKKKYVRRANKFYNKYGGSALIFARFVPIVRTFVPIVAGMAGMKSKKFMIYNIIGGFLWGAGITLLGYYLGEIIPGADKFLLPIVLVIIFLSILPGLIHLKEMRKDYS
jgi:membrane-associated protein